MSDDLWSVRGVDAEARQAAKMAAVGAGTTLGAWLVNAIYKQCGREKVGSGRMVAEGNRERIETVGSEPRRAAAVERTGRSGHAPNPGSAEMPTDPKPRFEVPAKFRNRYCKEHHVMPCDHCAKRAVEEGGTY